MNVYHTAGAVRGDDYKAIVLAGCMLGVGVLADRCTQYRLPVLPANQVGLLLRSAFIIPLNQLSMAMIGRCGQIARKNGPLSESGAPTLFYFSLPFRASSS